jgi:hypothetical protein
MEEVIPLSNYVRKAICFNVSNTNQAELLDWLNKQSEDNFSGFVKTILYSAMIANKKTDIMSARKSEKDLLF